MACLDIIIPVKDRLFTECLLSLLSLDKVINQIFICDGGSTTPEVVKALKFFQSKNKVKILDYPINKFNKSILLNQGILQAKADFLLISDADIIWNESAINSLLQPVKLNQESLCYIQQVIELKEKTNSLTRERYQYTIQKNSNEVKVIITKSTKDHQKRPGCGLVCGHRQTFWKLGGYKENFNGWGWEDKDLLMRAEVLGCPILQGGTVIHQSHSDTVRNQFHNCLVPIITRNRNILTCIKSFQKQEFLGDLPIDSKEKVNFPTVKVQFPEQLMSK